MKLISLFVFLICSVCAQAQVVNRFFVDLTTSQKGKLSVSFDVPSYNRTTLIYQIPKGVPGSYSIKNYGKYISNFKAYDANGKKLKTVYNAQENNFTISDATQLAHITYDVRQTWTDPAGSDYVFQPGGTYFEPGSLFCINTFAVFGYFDGFTNVANEIHIKKEPALYCATSADIVSSASDEDVVKALDYTHLQDNPLVYLKPDTASLQVNNCRFRIAVFSRNGKITSQKVTALLRPVLTGAFASFFPVFPISNYTLTFLFPGWQDKFLTSSGGMGAMEHRNSSVYFYGETANDELLDSFLKHVVAHEFLHVLTPLSLQSEQIFNFNYRQPQGSQHLWLYEGGIEYLSNQLLCQYGIFSVDDFLNTIREKTIYSDHYKNISMTEFSRHIFENNDMKYYANVYNKGALVAFLLDIRINELTAGRLNLGKIIRLLEEKYRGRYFNDNELFDEIVSITHPALRQMIDDYIIGTKELPVKEYLHKIGYAFTPEKPDSIYTFGRMSFEFDVPTQRCLVRDASPQYNAFGLDKGDAIVAVNDTLLTEQNYSHFAKMLGSPVDERSADVRYQRKSKTAEQKNPPVRIKVRQLNYIEPEPTCADEQLRLRKMVLGR